MMRSSLAFLRKKMLFFSNTRTSFTIRNGQIPHAITDKGSFWWRDVLKLCDLFRGIATCKIGDGSTVLFWSDLWSDNVIQILVAWELWMHWNACVFGARPRLEVVLQDIVYESSLWCSAGALAFQELLRSLALANYLRGW
jgi:hypothetical protein